MGKRLATTGALAMTAFVVAVTCVPTGRDNNTVETPAGNQLRDYYFTVVGIHLSAVTVALGLLGAVVAGAVVYVLLGGLRRGSADET